MSKKILVCGATGNVGSEVIYQLMSKEKKVKAGVRSIAKAKGMDFVGVEVVELDFEKPETFENALEGVDRVFLVPPSLCPNSHELLIPFIERAKKTGVGYIVNLSAMGIHVDDNIPLRKIEIALEQSSMNYTLLQPNWFMQNFNRFFAESIKHKNAVFLPAADAKTSFIDVRDIAAVTVEVLNTAKHYGKRYVLTGSESMTYYEAAAALSEVLGKTVTYFPISNDDMRAALTDMGLPKASREMFVALFDFVNSGLNAPVSGDVSKVLRREPLTFKQYAIDYAEMWRED